MASNASYIRAASGPKNVKSQPGAKRTAAATNTALGRRNRMSIARRSSPTFSTSGPRPSLEGLDNGKSAWIEQNGAGYSGAQKRMTPSPQLGRTSSSSMNSQMFMRRGIIDTTYSGGKGSSVQKFNGQRKLNRMF